MFHKIKDVTALDDFHLQVIFQEGVTKIYDIKPLFNKWKSFAFLKQHPEEFQLVQVDSGGYGIVWNDDLDLSSEELWENGKTISTPFDGLLSLGDATAIWHLSDSTLRKAIAYGKLRNGSDVRKYGKQWIVSKNAMEREYGKPPAPVT